MRALNLKILRILSIYINSPIVSKLPLSFKEIFKYSNYSGTLSDFWDFSNPFTRYLAAYNSNTLLSPSKVGRGAHSVIKSGNLE